MPDSSSILPQASRTIGGPKQAWQTWDYEQRLKVAEKVDKYKTPQVNKEAMLQNLLPKMNQAKNVCLL